VWTNFCIAKFSSALGATIFQCIVFALLWRAQAGSSTYHVSAEQYCEYLRLLERDQEADAGDGEEDWQVARPKLLPEPGPGPEEASQRRPPGAGARGPEPEAGDHDDGIDLGLRPAAAAAAPAVEGERLQP